MNYEPNAKFKRLIGRTIDRVEIEPRGEGIVFHTDAGPMSYEAYGDCCSSTWIESIDDEAALLGTVTAAEEVAMPEQPYDEKIYDCLVFYGLKITTEKGRAIIDYRNSSNGYYGGSLEPR